MARRRVNQLIAAHYYVWRLTKRGGVWCADGRSNSIDLGRHSLGTRSETEAKRLLIELDTRCAVLQGRAAPSQTNHENKPELLLEDGRRLYFEYSSRPRVAGGVRQVSLKRYRPIFDKFFRFANSKGTKTWNAIDGKYIEQYLAKLESDGYAYGTLYLEGTTIKQAISWLVEKEHLTQSKPVELRLKKPVGTNTHCWTGVEFSKIVSFCRSKTELHWLADICIALGSTGLRISELAALNWSDIDLTRNMISLIDESMQSHKGGRPPGGRTLKSGRSRSLPINSELKSVLDRTVRNQDGFVFHGPKGGKIKPDTLRNILKRSVLLPLSEESPDQLSARFTDGRLHSFRHYFCSMCANQGVPQQVVMQWLGHRESGMVQHYYHLYDDESNRQMDKINLGITAGA